MGEENRGKLRIGIFQVLVLRNGKSHGTASRTRGRCHVVDMELFLGDGDLQPVIFLSKVILQEEKKDELEIAP